RLCGTGIGIGPARDQRRAAVLRSEQSGSQRGADTVCLGSRKEAIAQVVARPLGGLPDRGACAELVGKGLEYLAGDSLGERRPEGGGRRSNVVEELAFRAG